jgi:hypothetical protein
MQMLSDDDRNLIEMTAEELDGAWDLWFDLAQTTNDHDPAYEHGVFAGTSLIPLHETPSRTGDARRRSDPHFGGRPRA